MFHCLDDGWRVICKGCGCLQVGMHGRARHPAHGVQGAGLPAAASRRAAARRHHATGWMGEQLSQQPNTVLMIARTTKRRN